MNKFRYRFFLNLTSRCNMNCSYCYQGGGKMKKEMSKKVVDRFTKYIEYLGAKRCRVNLFGGEPTLKSDLIDYLVERLDLTKLNGISMVTNFKDLDSLDRITSKVLKESNGQRELKILASNKEGIETRKQARYTDQIRYVLTPENFHGFSKETINNLLKEGFKMVDIVFDYYSNWNNISKEDISNFYKEINFITKVLPNVNLKKPLSELPEEKECSAMNISIDSNGDIVMCNRLLNTEQDQKVFGNILGATDEEIDRYIREKLSLSETLSEDVMCYGLKNSGIDILKNIESLVEGYRLYSKNSGIESLEDYKNGILRC